MPEFPQNGFESVSEMIRYLRSRLDHSDSLVLHFPPTEKVADLTCAKVFSLNGVQLEVLLNEEFWREAKVPVSVQVADAPPPTPIPVTDHEREEIRLATEKDWPIQEPYYGKIRDLLNAGETLPFPESPIELTSMIYALIDHDEFFGGNWAASMERLLNVALSDPVPRVSAPKDNGYQSGHQPYVPRPRSPREPADKRDIMRRHNKVEVDADGRLQLRIRRHNHQTLDRLELQVDVLKENQDRWPGEISLPLKAAEFRDWAATRCRF